MKRSISLNSVIPVLDTGTHWHELRNAAMPMGCRIKSGNDGICVDVGA